MPARIMVIEPTGYETEVIAKFAGQDIVCVLRERLNDRPGDTIALTFRRPVALLRPRNRQGHRCRLTHPPQRPEPPDQETPRAIRLDRAASLSMVPPRRPPPAKPRSQTNSRTPSLSIETIDPCRICSANFACATSTSPTASAFRRCANILPSTATPTIGISRILPRGRSAARRWCSRRPPRSRPRAGFRRRISASGAKGISSRSSGSRASSNSQGARAGIQLAHAGRKGSTYRPGAGQGAVPESAGGWRPVAPSAIAFSDSYAKPDEMTVDQIKALQSAFAVAAERAAAAGFDGDRDSRRARLFDSRVPVAVQQSPRRRLWRLVRQSDAISPRMRRGGATRAARALPALRANLGDRLGRRRMGHRPIGRARAPSARSWRRCDRLLVGRQCREGGDSRSDPDIRRRSPSGSGARRISPPPRSA